MGAHDFMCITMTSPVGEAESSEESAPSHSCTLATINHVNADTPFFNPITQLSLTDSLLFLRRFVGVESTCCRDVLLPPNCNTLQQSTRINRLSIGQTFHFLVGHYGDWWQDIVHKSFVAYNRCCISCGDLLKSDDLATVEVLNDNGFNTFLMDLWRWHTATRDV